MVMAWWKKWIEPMVRIYAACALLNLAYNYVLTKDHIQKAGGLTAFVEFYYETNKNGREYAILAILLLSESHKVNAEALLKLNVIEVLLLACRDESEKIKNLAELALAGFVLLGFNDKYRQLKVLKLNMLPIINTLNLTLPGARYVAINVIMRLYETTYRTELKNLDVCTRMNELLNSENEYMPIKDRAQLALNQFNGGRAPEPTDQGGGGAKATASSQSSATIFTVSGSRPLGSAAAKAGSADPETYVSDALLALRKPMP